MPDIAADFEQWKLRRLAALKAPDGWLNIIARHVLSTGTVTIGSAEGNDIVLPAGPAQVGSLTEDEAGGVSFQPAEGGAPLVLKLDKKNPPRFRSGTLLLEVTTLNGENALRVRDTASTAPDTLAPIQNFDFDPTWRITAQWVPLAAARAVRVDTSKAIETEVEVTHKAVFTRDGRQFELLATHGTPERPQFVIRDLTARDATYAACRFIYGEDVTADSIVVDFNRAINPPCAYTEFAVCPLPPPENVLPLRIEAGEKRPTDH